MGWSEKDFCIKCDQGGKVLVCCDSRCPIAVHEKCLSFPAKFDEMGKFYCPHCAYRRAVEEMHQAKEKALSRQKALSKFLDTKTMNGDRETLELGISKGEETGQLLGVGKANGSDSRNIGNQMDKVNVHNHTVRCTEDQEEDRLLPECSKSVLFCKETDVSFLGDQNDVLCSRKGCLEGPSDCSRRLVVIGHRTESGPIVACGNESVSSEEGDTTKQFEMVEIGNKIQLQPQWQGDQEPGRIVEDHLNDNNLCDSGVIEKQGMEPEAKMVDNYGDTFEEYEGRIARQEEVNKKLQESPAISVGDPALEMHLKEKRGGQTTDSICTDSKSTLTGKRARRNDKSKHESVEANCLRRSSRNSASPLRTNVDQFEKIHATSKSRKLNKPAPEFSMILCPNARRKSLPWTDVEETMLKEGVQKFSTTVNKNIPWRKILDFGRHVFDGSRTPVDLKDKWRNMLAKVR